MIKDNPRYVALELALTVSKDGDELISNATKILAFMDDASSKSESSTTAKKTRTKAASSSSSESTTTTSSTSAAATTAEPPKEAAPEAPAAKPSTETGTSPAPSVPSLDAVRAALTQCQARNKGDISAPRAILVKYAPTGTLGSLKEEDRQKVIDECNSSNA